MCGIICLYACFSDCPTHSDTGHRPDTADTAGLLFLCAPINVGVATYVYARSELLAALFSVLTIRAFLVPPPPSPSIASAARGAPAGRRTHGAAAELPAAGRGEAWTGRDVRAAAMSTLW